MSRRVILVTGANRGIGNEVVLELSRQTTPDDRILLSARVEEDAINAAAQINQHVGKNNVVPLHLDIENEHVIHRAVEYVRNTFGRLDVFMNNAAYIDHTPGISESMAVKTIEINYFATVKVTEAFLPLLTEGSRLINISSGAGVLDSKYSEEKKIRFFE